MAAWTDVVSAVAAVVQGAAVVAAGLFGYFKFVRGRTFKPRCTLDLDARVVGVGGNRAMRVDVTIENSGQAHLTLAGPLTQRLEIHGADKLVWDDARSSRDGIVLWSEGSAEAIDLLSNEAAKIGDWELEPGERLERSLLVPVHQDDLAFRVRVTVQGISGRRRRLVTWQRDLVVVPGVDRQEEQ